MPLFNIASRHLEPAPLQQHYRIPEIHLQAFACAQNVILVHQNTN